MYTRLLIVLMTVIAAVPRSATGAEGAAVISASPRGGYFFKMANYGNLGLYIGGSYLNSDFTAHRSLAIPSPSITPLTRPTRTIGPFSPI